MKKVVTNKYTYIFIIIFLISFSFMNSSYSKETKNVQLVECDKSSAYLEWELLSPEEKKATPMPSVCDKEQNNLQYYSFNFSVRGSLPTSYNGSNTKVKDQQSTGQCWAFATTTAIESYIKKEDNLVYNFSPRHIEYSSTRSFLNGQINDHGYNRTLGSGGHFYMSSNYLINHYGPIAEQEMPFENNENKISINQIQNKNTLVDVNNIVLSSNTVGQKCSLAQIQDIKQNIYSNGSVLSTTYMTTESKYYNSSNAAYYYNGSNNVNHAITIVGWDDYYSKDKFSSSTRPSTNGAWLVQNSYGTNFGQNGYYYISYEDVHICDLYMSIDGIDYEIEDNSYILDKLGAVSYMGYVANGGTTEYKTAYAMNVFTKENKKEILKEVTFGSNGSGHYTIYYMEGKATSTTPISKMQEIGQGYMDYAGYITHKIDSEIIIDTDITNFTIAIYYDMDTSTKPIPISDSSVSNYEYVTISPGFSFVSYDGNNWSDLSNQTYDAIASIKAFTNDIDYSLEINNYSLHYNNDALLEINTSASNINLNELTIYIQDQSNNPISYLDINYNNESNLSKISITLPRPITTSSYTIIFYYKEKFIDSFTITIAGQSSLTSTKYIIDYNNSIIYINPNTTITAFLNNIIGEKGSVYQNQTLVTSGYIATNMTIDNYVIIVKGDITGDGYVKMNDVMKISKYIVEGNGLDSTLKKAADVTGDNYIKMNDVMKISKYIVEGGVL